MALLKIHHVSKSFPIEGGLWRRVVSRVEALKDVSFEIARGESVALVGGSGCGKSTLAKIIVGLLEADSGEIQWENQAIGGLGRVARAQKIQMIFQDPYASLNPKLTIGTQLAEVLRLTQGVTGKNDVTERSGVLLEQVGLSRDATSHYPFQFSGGQRQRIAIARALAMNPELLIADEPLSALDVTTQSQILALFRQLMADLGLTFLLITHDLAVASEFAKRIIVLKAGEIVEEGLTSRVLVTPQHPYTQALLAAVPSLPC